MIPPNVNRPSHHDPTGESFDKMKTKIFTYNHRRNQKQSENNLNNPEQFGSKPLQKSLPLRLGQAKRTVSLQSIKRCTVLLIVVSLMLVLGLVLFGPSRPKQEEIDISQFKNDMGAYFPNLARDPSYQVPIKSKPRVKSKRSSLAKNEFSDEVLTKYDLEKKRNREFYKKHYSKPAESESKIEQNVETIKQNYERFADEFLFVDCWGNVISEEYFRRLSLSGELDCADHVEETGQGAQIRNQDSPDGDKYDLTFWGKIKRDVLILFGIDTRNKARRNAGSSENRPQSLFSKCVGHLTDAVINSLRWLFIKLPLNLWAFLKSLFASKANSENQSKDGSNTRSMKSVDSFSKSVKQQFRATRQDYIDSGLRFPETDGEVDYPRLRELVSKLDQFDSEENLQEWLEQYSGSRAQKIRDFRVPQSEEMLKVIGESILLETAQSEKDLFPGLRQIRSELYEYLAEHEELGGRQQHLTALNETLKALLARKNQLSQSEAEQKRVLSELKDDNQNGKNRHEKIRGELAELKRADWELKKEYAEDRAEEVRGLEMAIGEGNRRAAQIEDEMADLERELKRMSKSVSVSEKADLKNGEVRQLSADKAKLESEIGELEEQRRQSEHKLGFIGKRLHFLRFQLLKYQKHREMYLFVEKIRIQNEQRGSSLQSIKTSTEDKMRLIKEFLLKKEDFGDLGEDEEEWEIDESVLREIFEESNEADLLFDELLDSLKDSIGKILEKSGDWDLDEYDRKIESLHLKIRQIEDEQRGHRERVEELSEGIEDGLERVESIDRRLRTIKEELGVWGDIEEKRVKLEELQKQRMEIEEKIRGNQKRLRGFVEKVETGLETNRIKRKKLQKKLAKFESEGEDWNLNVERQRKKIDGISQQIKELEKGIKKNEAEIEDKTGIFKRNSEYSLEKRKKIVLFLRNVFLE